ncbi:LytTR family DNA-binding domain-containing protein [Arenicella sp. 4NH20-0111]|uniref:LytTR family DNA-binding domain-containing protein n=1 Tax=Arenicella sp. 4NH20-0111 TaxID=3127648 RepID=UPI00333F3252
MNGLSKLNFGRFSDSKQASLSALFYLIIVLGFASVMTIGRAYNTHNLHVLTRSTLWVLVCALIVFQALGLDKVLRRITTKLSTAHLLRTVIALFTTTVLMTIELAALKYTPLLPKEHDPFWEFLVFTSLPVTLIGGFALAMRYILTTSMGVANQRSNEKILRQSASSDLASRTLKIESHHWPIDSIDWVKAQEHYLEVCVKGQVTLVRGRFSLALKQLAHQKGIQPHRSWWVSDQQIDGFIRQGRDYKLRLKSGQMVPLARSRVSSIKEQGYSVS